MLEPRHPDFEERLLAAPDDEASYLIYADWLEAQGSPRGALIATQAALRHDPGSAALARAEQQLLAAHPGFLANGAPQLTVEWQFGFWRRVWLRAGGWQALENPSARFLHEVALEVNAADQLAPLARLHRTLRGADLQLRGPTNTLRDEDLTVLQACTQLRSLALYSCEALTPNGLELLRRFTQLERLDLRNCPLSDELALHLLGLPLKHVQFNQLSPKVSEVAVESLAAAPLETLGLTSSRTPAVLEDRHLSPLQRHPSLNTLLLGDVRLGVQGARCLASLPRLRSLDLLSSTIDDAGVWALAQCQTLEALQLGDCARLTDEACTALATLPQLSFLDCSSTHLTAAGVRALASLRTLRVLDLSFVPLDDAAVAALAPLQSLTDLGLRYSGPLTDRIIDTLAKFPALRRLDLSNSSISPEGIDRLAHLPLSELGLEGCAPETITRARQLPYHVQTRDGLEFES